VGGKDCQRQILATVVHVLSGATDVHHRGTLLLILVAIAKEKAEDKSEKELELVCEAAKLKDDALELVKTYLEKAQPMIRKTAKMLDNWAPQMYQKGLDKQGLKKLETSLREITGESQIDTS
jgi:hypothetical protein